VVRVLAAGYAPRVYDLTVKDEHEFVAGGLLVHNCVWGACALMPELAINAPTEVRVLNGRNGMAR